MSENEELLYATYIMLLRQGIELPGSFIVKRWGLYVPVGQEQQEAFFRLFFPDYIDKSTTFSCVSTILVLGTNKKYAYKDKRNAWWKIISGRVNRLGQDTANILLPGDEVNIPAEKACSFHSLDVPSVLLQLEAHTLDPFPLAPYSIRKDVLE